MMFRVTRFPEKFFFGFLGELFGFFIVNFLDFSVKFVGFLCEIFWISRSFFLDFLV